MTLLRVDHTAVIVRDIDQTLERYRLIFGILPGERTMVPDQDVEVAFLPLGGTQLELIRPTSPTSGAGRFLERRGEGLHHVAFLVEDVRAELKRLSDEGVELIDTEPRRGGRHLIAFVHPRATGGILVELVQHEGDQQLQA
jgi:methylmalonyl-CoA/ethylmalonyl-CoA epimerase